MDKGKNPFEMTIDLSSFKHLGEGLYSGLPAVMTEVVANAWDAGATLVEIKINSETKVITVSDNGHGMNEAQLDERFLSIGYERRKHQATILPNGRMPMGRKGIGKLSLFAIANSFEVRSKAKGWPSTGVAIDREALVKQAAANSGRYFPDPVKDATFEVPAESETGTEIRVTGLKLKNTPSERYIRQSIARRFAVIGPRHNFEVRVNGVKIGLRDRNYIKHVQFAWCLDEGSQEDLEGANDAIGTIRTLDAMPLKGWFATVFKPSQLKETKSGASSGANGIVVMVRGRVAHENLLDLLGEARHFAQYLIGEVHADFLDPEEDGEADAITSARQMLRLDDPKVRQLIETVRSLVNAIALQWDELRGQEVLEELSDLPAVKEWLDHYKKDRRAAAEKLLVKVGQVKLDDEGDREDLVKFSILAFEKLSAQEAIKELENLNVDDLQGFMRAIGSLDEFEAALYHDIVKGRVSVLKEFESMVEDDDLEADLQQLLFKHLWLFDPSWSRETGGSVKEVALSTYLKSDALLTKEIRESRLDIAYRNVMGDHVVIELKRASAKPSLGVLIDQVKKYTRGIRQHELAEKEYGGSSVRCFILLNKLPGDWNIPSEREEAIGALAQVNAEVRTYKSMIADARATYEEFIERDEPVRRVSKTLDDVSEQLGNWREKRQERFAAE